MATLKEGIYEIPDDCTVLYSQRRVIVKKMAPRPKVLHCSDCIHQKSGRKTKRYQGYDSFYCDARPKWIGGEGGYFYNAQSSKVACYQFEKKHEDNEHDLA